MMPYRCWNGVSDTPSVGTTDGRLNLTTCFSNSDGRPYARQLTGSPGSFIHCGTFGGRFAVFGSCARAAAGASAPAAARPVRARKVRRDLRFAMVLLRTQSNT